MLPPRIGAQYKIGYDDNKPVTLALYPDKRNGLRAEVSLVALFTAGAADRNGFRLGAGFSLSYTADNWTVSGGFDAYKANQKFGLGTTYTGLGYSAGKFDVSYLVNKYHQGDKQISGLVALGFDDFGVKFEDDILAMPFTGFKVYDRYRTAALEFRYKGVIAGTNVYTTDVNGVTDVSPDNPRGMYHTGKQLSSPIYVGYTSHDMIVRYGLNSQLGGLFGQNGWHRMFFNTPDFKTGGYKNQFLQIGVDKPYTLY